MIEERKTLQKQLDAIEVFMASVAHKSYTHTLKTDLLQVEAQLLDIAPDQTTLPALNQLHGNRQTLISQITFFEDARSSLKERISTMLDDEKETATTT